MSEPGSFYVDITVNGTTTSYGPARLNLWDKIGMERDCNLTPSSGQYHQLTASAFTFARKGGLTMSWDEFSRTDGLDFKLRSDDPLPAPAEAEDVPFDVPAAS